VFCLRGVWTDGCLCRSRTRGGKKAKFGDHMFAARCMEIILHPPSLPHAAGGSQVVVLALFHMCRGIRGSRFSLLPGTIISPAALAARSLTLL